MAGLDRRDMIEEALADAWPSLPGGKDIVSARTASGDEVMLIEVPATEMRSVWWWFRERRYRTGWWPIAVGAPWDVTQPAYGDTRYAGRDARSVVLERSNYLFDDDGRSSWLPDEPEPPFEATDDRFWVDVAPHDEFHYETRSAPGFANGPGLLALLPVAHGWQVIESIRWSDGNTFPSWVHAETLQRWERAGAELASIDHATIDLYVPEPPADSGQLFDLALELIGYGDTFNGTYGEVNKVASMAATGTVWTFWWD